MGHYLWKAGLCQSGGDAGVIRPGGEDNCITAECAECAETSKNSAIHRQGAKGAKNSKSKGGRIHNQHTGAQRTGAFHVWGGTENGMRSPSLPAPCSSVFICVHPWLVVFAPMLNHTRPGVVVA